MTIKSRAPVREHFSCCSSGNGGRNYYSCKGLAINAFDNALQDYSYHFDRNEMVNCPGDEGRATFTVCDENDHPVGIALLSWYRMPSGNYEFTGYIA